MKINDEGVRFDCYYWFFRKMFIFFYCKWKNGYSCKRGRQSLLERAPLIISRVRIRKHDLNLMSSSLLLCFLAQKKYKTIQFALLNTPGWSDGFSSSTKANYLLRKNPVIFSLSRHWFELSSPEMSPASLPEVFLSLSRFPRAENRLFIVLESQTKRLSLSGKYTLTPLFLTPTSLRNLLKHQLFLWHENTL